MSTDQAMTEAMTEATTEATTDPQPRQFHERAFDAAVELANHLFETIPELEGVAVVPSWYIQQDRIPAGVIVGRDGPLQTPQELFHMSLQLHSCLRVQLENVWQTMSMYDEQMSKMAEEINAKQQQLNELDALIRAHGAEPTEERSPSGGAPPAST